MVHPNGLADTSGVKKGDVLVLTAGQPVTTLESLAERARSSDIPLDLELRRAGAKVTVALATPRSRLAEIQKSAEAGLNAANNAGAALQDCIVSHIERMQGVQTEYIAQLRVTLEATSRRTEATLRRLENTATPLSATAAEKAIAAEAAKEELKRIEERHERESSVGFELEPITAQVASALGLESGIGAFVRKVQPETSAAKAGLLPSDILLSVNDQPLRGEKSWSHLNKTTTPGPLRLQILRSGKTLSVAVAVPPINLNERTQQLKRAQANVASTGSALKAAQAAVSAVQSQVDRALAEKAKTAELLSRIDALEPPHASANEEMVVSATPLPAGGRNMQFQMGYGMGTAFLHATGLEHSAHLRTAVILSSTWKWLVSVDLGYAVVSGAPAVTRSAVATGLAAEWFQRSGLGFIAAAEVGAASVAIAGSGRDNSVPLVRGRAGIRVAANDDLGFDIAGGIAAHRVTDQRGDTWYRQPHVEVGVAW
jgi:C-terminal processing protease CtpA/Prc